MNIEDSLNEIDEMIEKAWAMPLSGGKCLLDPVRLRDLLDEIRGNMPAEIRQAKKIVSDRGDILAEAKKEAEGIIRNAEERARVLVSQEEIVKNAEERAREIATQTQQKCREMRRGAQDFAAEVLRQSEECLTKQLNEVRQIRTTIRKPVAKPAEE